MIRTYDSGFAAVYDRVFTDFARAVAPVIHRYHDSAHGESDKSLLDLCCGTGQLARYFADHGYRVTASDRSGAMLERARINAGEHSQAGTIRLIEADVTSTAVDHRVSLVTCTFDSLNHLPDLEAVIRAFERAFDALVDGGIFVFDVHTLRGLEQQNHVQIRDSADLLLVSRITYDPFGRRAVARICGTYHCDEAWRRFEQNAVIAAWSVDEIVGALTKVGFRSATPCRLERLGVAVPDPESVTRLYFVAER